MANKSVSAKRIRKSFVQKNMFDTEEAATANVESAQELANVAISIETLTENQERIFQDMLEALQEIPDSVRERERQSEKLLDKIFDAIFELEKSLETETDPEKRKVLEAGISTLKGKGADMFKTTGYNQRDNRPASLGESIASHYFGVDPALKRQHGFVKGFGKALVRDTKKAFGISSRPNKVSFDEMLESKKMIANSSRSISEISESTRQKRIADSLTEEVAEEPKYTADLAPDFAAAANKFDEQFGVPKQRGRKSSGTGSAKLSKERMKSVSGGADYQTASLKLLKDIAQNTKNQLELLRDNLGADKNENVSRGTVAAGAVAGAAAAKTTPKFASSGTDYDDPNREVTKEEGGGTDEGGLAGGIGGLLPVAGGAIAGLGAALLGKGKQLFSRLNPFNRTSAGGPSAAPNARNAANLASDSPATALRTANNVAPNAPATALRTAGAGVPPVTPPPRAAGGFFSNLSNKVKTKIPAGLTSRVASLRGGLSGRLGGLARGGAARVAGRGILGRFGKVGLKSVLKKIPLVGAVAGLGFGASRLLTGDWKGALGEVASGAAGSIPGIGTAASMGIDAAMAARDAGMFEGGEAPPEAMEDMPITPGIEPVPQAQIPATATMAANPQSGRVPVANALEQATNRQPQAAPPIINNITNNNVAPQGGGGGQQTVVTSVSIRDVHSSYMRFQERRMSRVL
jgi:hypothetical protein